MIITALLVFTLATVAFYIGRLSMQISMGDRFLEITKIYRDDVEFLTKAPDSMDILEFNRKYLDIVLKYQLLVNNMVRGGKNNDN